MIIKKLIASYFCAKGKTSLSNKNFISALELFKKAEKYEESYDIAIYKGLTEFFLNDLTKSIFTLQHSLLLIKKEQKLNDNEKKYLEYYVLDILLDALKITKQYKNLDEYEKRFKSLKYDKAEVRGRLLRWFPN